MIAPFAGLTIAIAVDEITKKEKRRTMKNTPERMIELYQEMLDGYKHEFLNKLTLAWQELDGDGFYTDYEYRIRKDKIAEAAEEYVKNKINAKRKYEAFKAGAEWYRDNNND